MRVSWDNETKMYRVSATIADWTEVLGHCGACPDRTRVQTILDVLIEFPAAFRVPDAPGMYDVSLSLVNWHFIAIAAVQAGLIGRPVTVETANAPGPWHSARSCHRSVGERGAVKTYARSWRRNGRTKFWSTRPGHFRIPVKFRLRDCDYITETTGTDVHLAEDCPYDL